MDKPRKFELKNWTREYISEIPERLPKGKFLIHNRVTAQRKIGRNGFRAWLAEDVTNLVVCNCQFGGIANSERHTHYTTSDNANRPHWIELPTDHMMPPDWQESIMALCFNPSDEIEAVIRRLIMWLPDEDHEAASEWLDELLQIRELLEDEDDEELAA